jgi:trehalose 6-phosphate synthase
VTGRFAEPDWLPITYVKRAYSQASLAGLYRLAKIGLVTPLRDGMNLVAHEYVGAQDPEDPGVLVLSRFAGAAEIFHDALIINPFDTDETAEAMRKGLVMPLEERKARWKNLMAAAQNYSVDRWAENFLDALMGETKTAGGNSDPQDNADNARADDDDQMAITKPAPQTPGMPFVPWLKSLFSGT